MLKKLLFSSLLLFAFNTLIFAQCTPGNYTIPGTYPDTVTNLPKDTVGILYNAVMTFVIPADTLGIPIDSIGITGITGFPTGFTYTPNNTSYYWHGGTVGCILISGTATNSQVGTYNLVIHVNARAGGGFINYVDSLMGYRIKIINPLGVLNVEKEKFAIFQNIPNPFSKKTEIIFTSPVTDTYQFTVFNLLGEVISKQVVNAKAGENKIEFNASGIPMGIYMYMLGNKSKTITKRMIVSEN